MTTNWIGPKLDKQSSLYGSLGVSFVVLGWLYVMGRLMVAAPVLNAAVFDRRRGSSGQQDAADAQRKDRDRRLGASV